MRLTSRCRRPLAVFLTFVFVSIVHASSAWPVPGDSRFANVTTANGLGSNTLLGVYVDGGTVYAATNAGLGISTDGAATFTNKRIANGLGSNVVNGVYASGLAVYAATGASGLGGLGISTDGGATFTNKNRANTSNGLGNNTVYGVYAVGSTIYAATAGGLSISTDGGTTFTNKTTANGLGNNSVNDVFASGGTIYAATGGGLSFSTDSGTTFANKTTADGLGSNGVNGVYVVGSTVYAATNGGLGISTDLTATPAFTNKTTADGLGSNFVYGVYVVGSTVYAATSGGLSISTDGGATFTNKTTANGLGNNQLYGVNASGSTVYAATLGGLSFSPGPAPTVTGVAPSSGPAAGGTSITITGTNFASGGSFGVTVGGVAATGATVVSSTSITATTPAGTAGAADVVVTNDDGQTATSTGGFTYTAAPAPPPAPAPSGGESSEPSPSASASPSPSPSAIPTTAPSAPSRLDPVGNPQSPLIPAGGVPAGSTVFLVNGQASPVTVQPNATRDPVSLVFSAPGWSMRIEGRGVASVPLGLTSERVLVLLSERSGPSAEVDPSLPAVRALALQRARITPVARANGSGFAPDSPVKLYLLTVGYLGTVQTDARGAFDGSVPIPPGIIPGTYTLQVNGFAPDYSVRSLSIGALVRSPSGTATKSANVYFDALSSSLSPKAKAALRGLVEKTGTKAVKTVAVGYVQPTVSTGNDTSLSLQRARNVAAYLRSLGATGAYVARGDGVASQSGAKARRVSVTITYRR